jgi:hypothetical protein
VSQLARERALIAASSAAGRLACAGPGSAGRPGSNLPSSKGVKMRRLVIAAVAGTMLTLCATASAEVITPEFNAKEFAPDNEITNTYLPFLPGTVDTYKGQRDGKASVDTFEVTHERKKVDGVNTTVIHDKLTLNGKLHEKTVDWYAQDKSGNVWYFGEETATFKPNGELETTEGSWKAGTPVEKGGEKTRPGIFMAAKPELHVGYKEELAEPIAEDQFEVISLNSPVSTPYITTTRGLRTKETTPLEKGVIDNKVFVPGIGAALEVTVKGPEDRLELVSVKRP